jgi:S-methylmethionine-dependent homocysteine/selenocysteine methylase
MNTLLKDSIYLTDGGLETTLIFHHGIDLPYFASFDLLNDPTSRRVISEYYKQYLDLAFRYKKGFILESATWRANADWAYHMGYTNEDLKKINRFAIDELQALKKEYENEINPILISGCVGPRSDGYKTANKMTAQEAKTYHAEQIKVLKEAGVDLVSAITMNYLEEGLGIAMAAQEIMVPAVISFTVETDGKLSDGKTLKEAIETIDKKTSSYPSYYMINCAHPQHFANELKKGEQWIARIRGIRANASCKSHAELDESTTLDTGDTAELANWYHLLNHYLPNLQVFGGCCGTDVSHIKAICETLSAMDWEQQE